jgi:hypothetical protein
MSASPSLQGSVREAVGEGNVLKHEQAYCGGRDLAFARALNPSLQTFNQWLAQNKERIPLP